MHTLWTNLIYNPIYNALIWTAQHVTMQDVGLAVIVVTILIRFILMPLSKKSILSQYKTRLLQPKIDAIKAKGLSKEEEAKETFALYKAEGINPLSGCVYILVQLPILIALNLVFVHGVNQPEHLYSALSTANLQNTLFGIIDITKPFIPFAILAGIAQGAQGFLMPKPAVTNDAGFQAQLAKNMSVQMRYILPIVIAVAASRFAAALSLYWAISNMFSIAQELYFRKKFNKTFAK